MALIGLACATFGISPDAYFDTTEARRDFMKAYALAKAEAEHTSSQAPSRARTRQRRG